MSNCVFCQIAARTHADDFTVFENEHVFAVISLDQKPGNHGHVLVIPREHIANIHALPPELDAPLLAALRLVATAAKEAFAADGIHIRQNNGAASGQDVFHLHFHVIPRFHGDNFDAAPYERLPPTVRLAQAEKLRSVFSADAGGGPAASRAEALIGPVGMNRSALVLRDHDPAWALAYAAERERIQTACARPLLIEHIGSTAIPSLLAKPILDIAVLIATADLATVAAALRDLGYDYRGAYDARPGRFYAVLDHGEIRLCQIHLYTDPEAGWMEQLLFRDTLRAQATLRAEYADAKHRILQQVGADKRLYAQIKTDWVDAFLPAVRRAAAAGFSGRAGS